MTTNPVGPFSGMPVEFEGYDNGGSQVSLFGSGMCGSSPFNPCLVFSYDLTFSVPTTINSISFTGDAFNGAVFQLFNSSNDLLASLSESSGNVGSPVTYTMLTPGVSGTSFTLDLYDVSTFWTYVSDISVNATPEPASLGFLLPAAVLVCLVRRSRKSA